MKITAKITNYLDGKLSGKELDVFLQEVKNNPELSELLSLHKEVDAAIKDKDAQRMREKLDKAYIDFIASENASHKQKKTATGIIRLKKYIKYAAVIALLFSGTMYLIITRNKLSPNQLYSIYYQPYETDIAIRSTDLEKSKILEGVYLYQQGNYNEANKNFSEVVKSNPNCMEAYFYKAMSLMELQKYEEVAHSLHIILENDQSAYTTHADWYLGLCYLKMNKKNKAIRIFSIISDSTAHYYSVKAQELLEKIN